MAGVRDMKSNRLGPNKKGNNGKAKGKPDAKPDEPTKVELTLANAPIYSVKFLEAILTQLHKLNKHFEEVKK